MQHRQRTPFSHLDTDCHSESSQGFAQSTAASVVVFARNHSSLNSQPRVIKSNLRTELSWVLLLLAAAVKLTFYVALPDH